MLQSVLQKALELERPDMVQAALHHGAPAKEIDLLMLYKKLGPRAMQVLPSTRKLNSPAAARDRRSQGLA